MYVITNVYMIGRTVCWGQGEREATDLLQPMENEMFY